MMNFDSGFGGNESSEILKLLFCNNHSSCQPSFNAFLIQKEFHTFVDFLDL
jgi:hypothetical protein